MRRGALRLPVLIGIMAGTMLALAVPLPALASHDRVVRHKRTICANTNCIDPSLCGYRSTSECYLDSHSCTVYCCDPPGPGNC
jgi:hypothetical protein